MAITVRTAVTADATELAEVAAATFPLACPASVPASDITAFIGEHLSARRFADYLADPDRVLLAACHDGRIIGYAMLIHEAGNAELSKIYVLPDHHGTGAATSLMDAAAASATQRGAGALHLGVNQKNERAQRFYRKHGFEVAGTRTFTLGSSVQDDYIMSRPL